MKLTQNNIHASYLEEIKMYILAIDKPLELRPKSNQIKEFVINRAKELNLSDEILQKTKEKFGIE